MESNWSLHLPGNGAKTWSPPNCARAKTIVGSTMKSESSPRRGENKQKLETNFLSGQNKNIKENNNFKLK